MGNSGEDFEDLQESDHSDHEWASDDHWSHENYNSEKFEDLVQEISFFFHIIHTFQFGPKFS
jgi:hypothetical protein